MARERSARPASGNAQLGAPTASLTTTRNNSAVVGVGTDAANGDRANRRRGESSSWSTSISPAGQRQHVLDAGADARPFAASGTAGDDQRHGARRRPLQPDHLPRSCPRSPTRLTINVPAGTVVNDVMVASIGVSRPRAATITPPAGWTLAPAGRDSTRPPRRTRWPSITRSPAAAEPATYSWTFSATTGAAGGIQSFAGVDTTNPVDIDAGSDARGVDVSAAPASRRRSNNAMIVRSHTFSSSATWTITGRTRDRGLRYGERHALERRRPVDRGELLPAGGTRRERDTDGDGVLQRRQRRRSHARAQAGDPGVLRLRHDRRHDQQVAVRVQPERRNTTSMPPAGSPTRR